MRVVIDANRLFSALIRDGETRRTIYETAATLLAPEYLGREIARHTDMLQRRSGLPPEDFRTLLSELSTQIIWVPDEAIGPKVPEALQALGTVDVKDVPYLACALAIKADAIWSHDLDFDKQTLVPRVPHPDAALS